MELCDRDCNHCQIIGNKNSRMVTFILNSLLEKFGNDVYEVVRNECPILTCCFDCHVDGFCHNEGCEIAAAAEAKYGKPTTQPIIPAGTLETQDIKDGCTNCKLAIACGSLFTPPCAKLADKNLTDLKQLQAKIVALTTRVEASYTVETPLKELSAIVYEMRQLSVV